MRRLVLLAVFLCVMPLVRAASDPSTAYRIEHEDLASPAAVRRSVAVAASGGFDTILAPASLTPDNDANFDALDEILREAAVRNMHVHASVHVGRAVRADEIPASREHVLYRHPEWLMVPRDLAVDLMRVDLRSPEYVGRLWRWTRVNLSRADGLYVSPIDPDAVTYLADQVVGLVRRYAVDGVHLDGLRFPDSGFDYSRRALDLFRADVRRRLAPPELARMNGVEAIDPFAYPEEFPEDWRSFRQSRLTALVARLHAAVRVVRPALVVSAAVTRDPEQALSDHMQDWRSWMDARFIDAVAPTLISAGTRGTGGGAP